MYYTHLWISWIHLCQRQTPLPPVPASKWELELLSWWSCVDGMVRAIAQCLVLYPRWKCVGCHTGFDSNFYANQLTFAVFFDTGIATARVICKIFAVYLQICIVHSTPGSCFISLNKTLSEKCVADTRSGRFVCARFKTRCRDLQFPMQCFLRTPFMLINVILPLQADKQNIPCNRSSVQKINFLLSIATVKWTLKYCTHYFSCCIQNLIGTERKILPLKIVMPLRFTLNRIHQC